MEPVADFLRRSAATAPTKRALAFEHRALSFSDIDERSNRVANALLSGGASQTTRVAYLDKNAPEYFEMLFGAAKANTVLVGVNWRLAPTEMAGIITDSQADTLVVGHEFASIVPALRREAPCLSRIVMVGGDPSAGGVDPYDAWLGRAEPRDPGLPARSDDVVLQVYTSGTTGKPKGAMLTNANFQNLHRLATDWWEFTSDSVNLLNMPLFHIAGVAWGLLGFVVGCESVLLRDVNVGDLLATIERERITQALFVPAVLTALVANHAANEVDLTSLRAIGYGASPIPEPVLVAARELLGARFVQVYGMTESTGTITGLRDDEHDTVGSFGSRLGSCGRALPWYELKIVDPDRGCDLGAGQVGEVWARSAQVMKGYWEDPEATAEAITADGWLRTGDLGFVDEDGYLFLRDRLKDLIITGGENVYPAEVESVLMAHPAVADVAVIGVPDRRWGETVKALVIPAPHAAADDAELISFARDRLAHYKCPTSVDFVAELPRNASGKFLKRVLREPYWADQQRRVH